MMRMHAQGERMSPVDHLEAMADRLSQGATNVKKIADAAKPLYDSLDKSQKHRFGMLGRMLMPERSRFAMDMMRHTWANTIATAPSSPGDISPRGREDAAAPSAASSIFRPLPSRRSAGSRPIATTRSTPARS